MSLDPSAVSSNKLSPAHWLLLALAVFTSFYANIWGFPLFDLDEGAFSEASREMLLNQDFISITMNGALRADKPVLTYWLQSASAAVFGNHAWAYRVPSVLAATLWAFILFGFLKKQQDSSSGLLLALVMSSSLQISLIGKAATADALLNCFLAGSLLSLFRYLWYEEKSALYWATFFTALGTLTKGPIAIAVPAITAFLFCLTTPSVFGRCLSILINWRAWLIFLLVVLPWPLMLYLKEGGEFFYRFFFEHNLGRYGEAMEGHSGGYYYYLIAMMFGFIPWSWLLLQSVFSARSNWSDPLFRYALIQFVFVLVFFSFSSTKLPHYLIYGSTGAFILIALQLKKQRDSFLAFLPQLVLTALIGVAAWIFRAHAQWIKDKNFQELLPLNSDTIPDWFFILLAAYLLILLLLMVYRKTALFWRLFISGLLLNSMVAFLLLPGLAQFQQNSVVEAAKIAAQIDKPLINHKIKMPSFNVVAGRPAETRSMQSGDLVFTRSRFIQQLPQHKLLFRQQGVALVELLANPKLDGND